MFVLASSLKPNLDFLKNTVPSIDSIPNNCQLFTKAGTAE